MAWIDDQSAYVGLQKKEQTRLALRTLSQSETYSVMSYAKRQVQLAGFKSQSRSPHSVPIKRKTSSEDLSTVTSQNFSPKR